LKSDFEKLMNRRLPVVIFAAAALAAAAAPAQAGALSECYKAAENRVQLRQCLRQELDETKTQYDKEVERFSEAMRRMDEEREKSSAAAGGSEPRESLARRFRDANRSFELYMNNQCGLEGAALEPGTGAGNQLIACRINLLHLRTGALRSFWAPADGSR